MPKPGDRVIIEGTKLGSVRREGELLEAVGSLLKIRWADGSESLLTPGAGTVRFAPAGGRRAASRSKVATGKGAGRGKATPKKAAAAKKAAGKKTASAAKGKAKKKK